MSADAHSIRKLQSDFIIPVGTQVVLTTDKVLHDGDVRLRGSVGVVVGSPSDNHGQYTIRFTDNRTAEAMFRELSLRRREVDEELTRTDIDLRPHVIYRCQVGSRAFGLATEESDDDIRGIYLPPADLHWSLYELPEQIETQAETGDEVYWELEKFLRLAIKGNPNILETLWTPVVMYANDVAEKLLAMREVFLTKHIYKTYSGYVLSQFRRMANAHEKHGAYKAKHAMHLLRLLYSGIEALRTGNIRIDVGEHREELLEVKRGGWPFEKAKAKALELDREFQEAYSQTQLPDRPDYQRVDEFLIWARRRMVDA